MYPYKVLRRQTRATGGRGKVSSPQVSRTQAKPSRGYCLSITGVEVAAGSSKACERERGRGSRKTAVNTGPQVEVGIEWISKKRRGNGTKGLTLVAEKEEKLRKETRGERPKRMIDFLTDNAESRLVGETNFEDDTAPPRWRSRTGSDLGWISTAIFCDGNEIM